MTWEAENCSDSWSSRYLSEFLSTVLKETGFGFEIERVLAKDNQVRYIGIYIQLSLDGNLSLVFHYEFVQW